MKAKIRKLSDISDIWKMVIYLSIGLVFNLVYISYKKDYVTSTIKIESSAVYTGYEIEKFIRYDFESLPDGEVLNFWTGKAIPGIKEKLPNIGSVVCIEYQILEYSDKTNRKLLDALNTGECN